QLAEAALAVGLPVLLKPSAGGGGKGMRVVTSATDLAEEVAAARREAAGAFGDDTLLVERYVQRPRHIEMQVFADSQGSCVALGERECSLQRRHQKIVEEAPSPLIDPPTRASMADSAVAAARACGYVGAGTVEFIVSADRPDEYFFMEMNTRLQVEHPVTEAVLGVDLVELQLRVAAGERLPWAATADVPAPTGHAVEARVYAEDPGRGFLPASGPVLLLREPPADHGVRVDSGATEGMEVGTLYDPMLAKVVAWGPDRRTALARLDRALEETAVLGVTTNVGFLRRLVRDPDVRAGRLDTGLVERRLEDLQAPPVPDEAIAAAAALAEHLDARGGDRDDPWAVRDGWRVSGPAPRRSRWRVGTETVQVEVTGGSVTVGGRPLGEIRVGIGEGSIDIEAGTGRQRYWWARAGDQVWLGRAGDAWSLVQERMALMHRGASGAGGGQVTSPMPGTVLAVYVEPGSPVEAGERLVVVEAMKMEHTVRAAEGGRVAEVLVQPGQSVRLDQPLVVMDAPEEET
ncbi:MAG TPA: biotin/lipoyl-containing protein, partial [Acidimicrobiales bacterium]|nr:biotin/lipoyl-containing protein [Acidimicrobiales bacterium]